MTQFQTDTVPLNDDANDISKASVCALLTVALFTAPCCLRERGWSSLLLRF